MKNKVPQEMYDGYSMNGKVEIYEQYVMSGSDRRLYHYSEELVNRFVDMGNKREVSHYPETDRWFYDALDKHNIEQKQYLIIGSEEPYYEGIAISNHATVTMVEYQRVTSSHPFLTTMTVEEFEKENYQYDGAISISSVEHSGLGRYGDSLDPDGDLKSMNFFLHVTNTQTLVRSRTNMVQLSRWTDWITETRQVLENRRKPKDTGKKLKICSITINGEMPWRKRSGMSVALPTMFLVTGRNTTTQFVKCCVTQRSVYVTRTVGYDCAKGNAKNG
jgi:hypothetical protein